MKFAEEKRDYLFDNLKGLLVIFVVFGHAIEYMVSKSDSIAIESIYAAIYTFHMPVFVFISGYFSKKNKPARIIELFIVYALWQLFIFPALLSLFTDTTFSENLNSIFTPEYTYWYILSLVTWKVITPHCSKIKYICVVSIFLGLLIGFTPGGVGLGYMSIGRTIAFYPFFLMGFFCTKEKFYELKALMPKWKSSILLILIIFASTSLMYAIEPELAKESYLFKIFYLKDAYQTYLTFPYVGMIARALLYILQFSAIFLVCTLAPTKKTSLYKISLNSLFIYLLHGIIVQSLKISYFKSMTMYSEVTLTLLLFLASVAFCYLLTLKPFAWIGKKLTSIPMKFILNEEQNN